MHAARPGRCAASRLFVAAVAVTALATLPALPAFAQGAREAASAPATAPAAAPANEPRAAPAATSASTPAPASAQAPSSDTSRPAPTSLLPTQAERDRFHRLAEELRCLVCQNQTLADSDADLATDLRREVETMMLDGRSDDEIKSFLVQRYGDFVLYRPPMQGNTWLLWLGPFALLVIGALTWWRVQRSHRATARPPGGSGDAQAELERARRLLD